MRRSSRPEIPSQRRRRMTSMAVNPAKQLSGGQMSTTPAFHGRKKAHQRRDRAHGLRAHPWMHRLTSAVHNLFLSSLVATRPADKLQRISVIAIRSLPVASLLHVACREVANPLGRAVAGERDRVKITGLVPVRQTVRRRGSTEIRQRAL